MGVKEYTCSSFSNGHAVDTPTVVLAIEAVFFAQFTTLFETIMLFKICFIKGYTITLLEFTPNLVNDRGLFVRTDG